HKYVRFDHLQGADPTALENKIVQYYGSDKGEDADSVGGHMDLALFILKQQCECLNESDCDEQLIISIMFNQAVKIHSIKFKGPSDKGPKNVRIFINQPRTLDFDMVESCTSVQDLEVTPSDLEGNPVNLRYVKFQNVTNIQIFVKDNQSGDEVTQIDHLAIIGTPINTTNMGDFKRVAGKKGESH
ncbi:thioredoxin-like protein 1, partial [Onthophagus taurus]|uniref:thioredoxin-like protein 1 n=1 Tax=Onthophagus taurus TaxID=166361 RepID=UPI0039BE2F1A